MNWFTNDTVTPRKAAAGILLRQRDQAEVLLARRNETLRFFGGHHVFPGGAVDPEDDPRLITGPFPEEHATALVAMVREVFEEAGILLTRGPRLDPPARRRARRDLNEKHSTFATLLAQTDQHIFAEDFRFAVNWLTPPWSPIRFDTDFFLCPYAEEPAGEIYEADGEIVGLDWLAPKEARRRWHADGSIRLSTPVAQTLRYLAAFPLEEALTRMTQPPGREMDSPNRFEPRPGITIIPVATQTLPPATHTNCVVIGEEALAIIDPGADTPEEEQHLLEHVQRLIDLGGRLEMILLTHGHPDHAAAADCLRQRFGAPVKAHPDATPPCTVDQPLQEGMRLPLAGDPPWTIRVLHTPGHVPGHCAFLEESTRTLFCGDMLANPGTIMIDPESGGDMDAYLNSLQKLLPLDFTLTVPGHGLPTWLGSGKEEIQALINHRLAREAKILAALDAGATTTQALLAKAYADVPEQLWPFAERQLLAHLIRLGRAR